MPKVGRPTLTGLEGGDARVRDVGFSSQKAEIAFTGNLRSYGLDAELAEPRVDNPVWTTALNSKNRYVAANLGYERLAGAPFSPAAHPLTPEADAARALLSPARNRVSVVDYISPHRHEGERAEEDADSRIPRKDASAAKRPHVPRPRSLSPDEAGAVYDQMDRTPTRIPPAPEEDEPEEEEEAPVDLAAAFDEAAAARFRDGVGQEWRVAVKTGGDLGAGTDADIGIVLIGEVGRSEEIILDDERNNFERHDLDNFSVRGASVGELQSIIIGYAHKLSGTGALSTLFGDAWQLAWLTVTDPAKGKTYRFEYNGWIDRRVPRVRLTPVSVTYANGSPSPAASPTASPSAHSPTRPGDFTDISRATASPAPRGKKAAQEPGCCSVM